MLAAQAMLEYRSLAFRSVKKIIIVIIIIPSIDNHNSHEHFLLGVTGIPDFLVNLWDWQATICGIVIIIKTKIVISITTIRIFTITMIIFITMIKLW